MSTAHSTAPIPKATLTYIAVISTHSICLFCKSKGTQNNFKNFYKQNFFKFFCISAYATTLTFPKLNGKAVRAYYLADKTCKTPLASLILLCSAVAPPKE